jgi:hypothetical protein
MKEALLNFFSKYWDSGSIAKSDFPMQEIKLQFCKEGCNGLSCNGG